MITWSASLQVDTIALKMKTRFLKVKPIFIATHRWDWPQMGLAAFCHMGGARKAMKLAAGSQSLSQPSSPY